MQVEDPLEAGVAIHSSIFTWRILWTEEPGGLRSVESQMATHSSIGASRWRSGKKFTCQCKETRVQSLGQEDTLE